jgi:translation elongation factor P/translation initiation factor 5A
MISMIEALKIKKEMCIILFGKMCKILEVKNSKIGKNGSVKLSLIGINIFNNQKTFFSCLGNEQLPLVEIIKKEYQVMFVDKTNLEVEVLDENSNVKKFSFKEEDFSFIVEKSLNDEFITTIQEVELINGQFVYNERIVI